MNTCLTLSDYSEPDWGPIEVGSDWPSYRSFWAAVLQYAAADGATAVLYDLDSGDDCLKVEIDGQTYPLVPPPQEYHLELLDAVRTLAAGGKFRLPLRRFFKRFNGSEFLGRIGLETPEGQLFWSVRDKARGVRIERKS